MAKLFASDACSVIGCAAVAIVSMLCADLVLIQIHAPFFEELFIKCSIPARCTAVPIPRPVRTSLQSTITMDVHEVRKRASILCLDVPPGTLFGVDLQAWTTGPKFKGVKIIPPGTHIFYYK